MWRRTGVFLSLVVALGAATVSDRAAADSTIKVKVNDQPITSYDITQRANLLKLTGSKGGSKAATEELIDETLQFIEGAKRGISISEGRVDQAIASIGGSMKLTPDQLKKALAQEGVDIKTLRRRIKSQMLWAQLVQAKLRFEKAVSSNDVTTALFQDKGGSDVTTKEFTLQQIIFVVPAGSSQGLAAQKRREAENFRGRYGGCEGAVAQAKQLKGVVVKSMGRRTSEDLIGPEGKEIIGTPVGKTTRPQKIDEGFVLVAVCSVKDIKTDAAARSQTEQKLLFEKNKELGKEYLAELRKKAVIEYR
jgi:peptidyl-prolyl cis-trans isomerase SurA